MNDDNTSNVETNVETEEFTILSNEKPFSKPNVNFIFIFSQICRFGIVGVIAAIVHYCCVVFLVETFALNPLVANIFAFIIAFQVSYGGHRFWTFSYTTKVHRYALPRLFFLQCMIFTINESLYALFIAHGLPYTLALILVLTILPLFTFTIAKLWIF